jgi:hypothetical protein
LRSQAAELVTDDHRIPTSICLHTRFPGTFQVPLARRAGCGLGDGHAGALGARRLEAVG